MRSQCSWIERRCDQRRQFITHLRLLQQVHGQSIYHHGVWCHLWLESSASGTKGTEQRSKTRAESRPLVLVFLFELENNDTHIALLMSGLYLCHRITTLCSLDPSRSQAKREEGVHVQRPRDISKNHLDVLEHGQPSRGYSNMLRFLENSQSRLHPSHSHLC